MKQIFIGIFDLSLFVLILAQVQTVEQPRILQYGIDSSSFKISASANSTSNFSSMAITQAQTSMNLAQQASQNANASQLLAVTAATAANVSQSTFVTAIASMTSLLAAISALNIAQVSASQAAQIAATYDSLLVQAQSIVSQQTAANAASSSAATSNNQPLVASTNLVQSNLNNVITYFQASCTAQSLILNIQQVNAIAAAQAAFALFQYSNGTTLTSSNTAAVASYLASQQVTLFAPVLIAVAKADAASSQIQQDLQSTYDATNGILAQQAESALVNALMAISQVFDLASASANTNLNMMTSAYNAALTLYQKSAQVSSDTALASFVAGVASLTSSTNSSSSSTTSSISANTSALLAGYINTNVTQTMYLANTKYKYNTNQCIRANSTLVSLSGTQEKTCQQLNQTASAKAQNVRTVKCATATSKFLNAISNQFMVCSN